ncbi:MAG: GNAT family N-acetyltransferase [Thermomicrobiales bacterium]
MSEETGAEPAILQDLGNGLILRRARFTDREPLADFHANTLVAADETPPLETLYYFVLDLMSGEHPTFQPGDFMLVEDTATGKIVSSLGLTSQTWTYEGIPFKFGQPDIVSTDPAYRRRGLVRAQLDTVHRWSAVRGELVQGITGIPWYYRQFGYEMALSLDAGRTGFRRHVPRLHDGESEPYLLRPATTDDLPFVMAMYRQATSRSVIAAQRDEALWRYDIERRGEKSGMRRVFHVIETAPPVGQSVGLVVHSHRLWGSAVGVRLYEVTPGVPFLAVTPSVLRHLDATGDAYTQRDGGEFDAICFNLGEQHPVYETIPDRLPQVGTPYAWFVRVPDLLAFVRHIAPALEARLAASAQSGYTGDIRVSFYRSGLRLRFHDGRITVEAWTPTGVEEGDSFFPDPTFLQLLFGFRSLAELQHAFPDCFATTDDARALLPILFPKKPSDVWSGG